MDGAGVDFASLVSFLLYDDIDYVLAAARRYPDRSPLEAQLARPSTSSAGWGVINRRLRTTIRKVGRDEGHDSARSSRTKRGRCSTCGGAAGIRVDEMSRLPPLTRDELDEPALSMWDTVVSTRGTRVIGENGALAGPFNAWLRAPEIGVQLAELGAGLRFRSSLEPRLLEIAVITVTARWQAEFEWRSHVPLAREHGVPESAIAAIARGDAPGFETEPERLVHSVAHQLSHLGRIDAGTYEEAHRYLGDGALVELVCLCGYYCLVSFTLNAFSVTLPSGIEPTWSSMRNSSFS